MVKPEQQPQSNGLEAPRPKRTRSWRWLRKGILFLALFVIMIYAVFQIPAVQNWVVKNVTQQLSNRLETRVTIDYFHLGFFNRIVLRGVYIEDYQQDTMLYARNMSAKINSNPWTVIRKGLIIDRVQLSGGRVNLRQSAQGGKNNIQQVLSKLQNPDREKSGQFQLDLKALDLSDIDFVKEDAYRGQRLQVSVGEGTALLRRLDLPGKRIEVRKLVLVEPRVLIDDRERSPAWLADQDKLAEDSTTQEPLNLMVDQFRMHGGAFELHNYRKEPVQLTPDDMINYRHLNVENIQIAIDSFTLQDRIWRGAVDKIAFTSPAGFVLNRLAADYAEVSDKGVKLHGMTLETPYSNIGDTLEFRYRRYQDFGNFPNAVRMRLDLEQAEVALRDIMTFAPGLEQNTFFTNNREEILRLDGLLRGPVNNLSGRNLNLILADGSRMEGRMDTRNLALKDEELLFLEMDELQTSMQTLRDLVPNFDPPDNFDKLGAIRFQGAFVGFFQDFNVKGRLFTDLGEADLEDINLNVKPGNEKATWGGTIRLLDFDLGAWTENPDFGRFTLYSEVYDGFGISGPNVRADLNAKLESFVYRGYSYENAELEGNLREGEFDGEFQIRDDNIDFSFTGNVNMADSVPTYDFEASVNRLDLERLNLSKRPFTIAGDFVLDLRNRGWSNLEGIARLRDVRMANGTDRNYEVDYLLLQSDIDTVGNRSVYVASEVLESQIEGRFNIEQIPQAVIQFLTTNHPRLSERLRLKPLEKPMQSAHFDYNLRIKDSKGLQKLFSEELGALDSLTLRGTLHGTDTLILDLTLPNFRLGQVQTEGMVILLDAYGERGGLFAAVDSTIINDRVRFGEFSIINELYRDSLDFAITYIASKRSILDKIFLDGLLYAADTAGLAIEFEESRMLIAGERWTVSPNNRVYFGKDFVEASDLVLRQGEMMVSIESTDRKGLEVSMVNLPIDSLNARLRYDPIQFTGQFNLHARVGNVFEMADLQIELATKNFLINGDDWGRLEVSMHTDSLERPLQAQLALRRGEAFLNAQGQYNLKPLPPESVENGVETQRNYFDFNVDLEAFPLDVAEYWIGNTVKNMSGMVNGSVRVYGQSGRPNIGGEIIAEDGALTINYLKTRYTFEVANINVDNQLFDASGTVFRDKYGNRATIMRGIRHDHLRDFGFNATMRTRQFLGLDTQKGDNKLFYGKALASGTVNFTGSFKRPDIYVNATSLDSTMIIIPVSNERKANELSYLNFVDKDAESESDSIDLRERLNLQGVALEMDLSVTPEAVMKIVFNEQAGDIIEGAGRGNIRIEVPRGASDFQMYGNYAIEEGDYLFTLYGVINKDFRIREGGTIEWTGDPFGAQIDLRAEYQRVSAPVANFIQEYLLRADDQIRQDARVPTDVDLVLLLRGDLMKPQIDFDITFPDLQGQLASYTDNKLRILKQDQNELNKQVMGLIVAGQFLPSDLNLAGTGTDIIYNTVSEFVSNQLSLLLTQLFSEFIGEDRFLSGVDLDIDYNQYDAIELERGDNVNRGDELQFQFKSNIGSDRLSILLGSNIGLGGSVGSAENSGAFFGNDVVIEYILNEDRTLKVRVFQRSQPTLSGSTLEVGAGLSFRKEFNSFGDFLDAFRKDAQKAQNGGNWVEQR